MHLISSLSSYIKNKLSANKIRSRPNLINYDNPEQLKRMIIHTKREMKRMAKDLNFIEAGRLRDELHVLEETLKNNA